MDRPPEPAWREHEERELLCNIIRQSPMNPRLIYSLIAQHRISPLWDDIPLPTGRTLNECRNRFDSYHRDTPYPLQPAPTLSQPQYAAGPGNYGGPTRMRTHYDPTLTSGRPLLPKTAPSTPSEAGPAAFPQSPLAEQQPAARKRGRPPKEEVVRRKAEAEARGETYPAPRSKRPKRPPSQLSSAPPPTLSSPYQSQPLAPPIMSTPTTIAPAETGSESSGSKRRRLQRPADIETTGMGAVRDPVTGYGSYESPPQTGVSHGQPSSSTRSAPLDADTRMEGAEEPAPSTRTQSYREIVGIRGSSSG